MKTLSTYIYTLFVALLACTQTFAQYNAKVSTRTDAAKIMVGDQVRLFIAVTHDKKQSNIQWAYIPDSFNHLEVVEKGKIDTLQQGNTITLKQRLLVTGFDSGVFYIPSFTFTEVSAGYGKPKALMSDSVPLLVQTVAVDTSKGFKGIKEIIQVKSTWLDYLGIIIAALVFLILLVFVLLYFIKNKKVQVPVAEKRETLQEVALRLLDELEAKQLWQHKQVKEYYIELTDIIRTYIEERFHTPALELTTDELLHTARTNKEMQPFTDLLDNILYTADLAKFAKADPMPHEHTAAIENARLFINKSKPVIVTETQQQP